MISSLTLLLPLLAPTEAVPLVFDPRPGTAVAKHFEAQHTLVVESFKRTMGDETRTVPMRTRVLSAQVLDVVDEVASVAEGRPAVLRRAYVGGSVRGEFQPLEDGPSASASSVELRSEVKDASVVFTWVPEEGAYGRLCDALELPERWLPDLEADLDCLSLLPEGPVEVGQRWTVGTDAMRPVLAPFGEGHFEEPAKGADRMLLRTLGAGVGANLQRAFGGDSSGTVTLELAELDGDLARVKVHVEGLNFVRDLSEYAAQSRLRREEEQGVTPDAGRLVVSLQGRGELVWNRATARATSLELALQETVTMGVKNLLDVAQADDTIVQVEMWEELRLTGTLRQSLRTEAGEMPAVPGPAR